ncbi:MAG: magnesium transporter, partial [Chromatiales bacterium]|nr:magnesium transporter [Chromatiales bacterium]
MAVAAAIALTAERLAHISAALKARDSRELATQLEGLHPAEVADLLESLPLDDRDMLWSVLGEDVLGDILAEAEDSVRAAQMRNMAPGQLAAVTAALDADDAVDILQDLPDALVAEVLARLDAQHRTRLHKARSAERIDRTARITDAFNRFSAVIQRYGGIVHEVRGDALVAEFHR